MTTFASTTFLNIFLEQLQQLFIDSEKWVSAFNYFTNTPKIND